MALRTPQTNGMVERFNSCISSEVLGINIYSHRALEQLLRGFNTAYNARRQRVLDGRTPNQGIAERLKVEPELANPAPHGRAGPCDTTKAPLIADAAKEVSQPDNGAMRYRIGGDRQFLRETAMLACPRQVDRTGNARRAALAEGYERS